MHALTRKWAAAAVLAVAALVAQPVLACTLVLQSPGSLRASADNTVLGSEVNGTTPATLTSILPLLSGITVEVASPTVVSAPGGYNSSAQTVQVAYTASVLGLIGITTQSYTTSSTSFSTGILGAVTMTMVVHNRVLNPNGFSAGTYTTRTVVTCHP